jgi:hypothetical protein
MLSVGETNRQFSEQRGGRVVSGRKKQAIQRAAQQACRRREVETSASASGTAGVTSAGERKERFNKWYGGRIVGGNKKRAIQRAARWTCRRREEQTSDSASGTVGKMSKRERNKRFSERCGGCVIGGRNKQAIQRAARRARCRKEKETSDSTSGAAGKASSRETNE